MTIKKPVTKPAVAKTAAAPGGATIADRFKLDVPDPKKAKKAGSVSSTAATIALCAGLAALIVAGILTFVMYQHWDFLQGA